MHVAESISDCKQTVVVDGNWSLCLLCAVPGRLMQGLLETVYKKDDTTLEVFRTGRLSCSNYLEEVIKWQVE